MGARVQPLGDSAITIELGSERSPELLREVHAAAAQIRLAGLDEIEDVVPAYLALSVFYDPLRSSFSEIAERVLEILSARDSVSAAEDPRHHVIPVRYDGVDLESVAAATKLTAEQVIELHTARTYTVDLLGFVPGWAYLSELDQRLQIARRPQPRPRVARGSVAIAATQTGIYPLDTPGGWHIIGNTNTALFDPSRDPPSLLKAGDTVRFERVA
ncbi:MAG TPA: 5-oxoprolinase subunit PxpB [Gemmatimonadaceae bacterium]